MTRQQLIDQLALKNGITKKDAKRIVEVIFNSMGESLKNGDRIEIRGFGSFKVKDYEGFVGRNPKTGEIVKVKSKKLPLFKVGKSLKNRVDM
jgi:integration host factor subunit beta